MTQGSRSYVTNRDDATFSVIDTSINEVIDTIELGARLDHVTISPSGKYVYMNDRGLYKTYVIDSSTNEVIESIDIGPDPHQIAIYVPVGDFNDNGRVDKEDATKVAYMVIGKEPQDLEADFNNNNRVDIGDAAKIAYYVAGKISEL